MHAVVIAGKAQDHDHTSALLEYSNTQYKALISINGKTIIERVIEALEGSKYIDTIHLVGLPPEIANLTGRVNYIEAEGALYEKIIQAVEVIKKQYPDEEYVLGLAGDIPLITSKDIDDFIIQCHSFPNYDYYFSIISKAVMEKAFPESKRTYAKIKDGEYCGGDLHFIKVETVLQHKDVIKTLIENRKSFLKQVLRVAPFSILKILFKRADIKEMERVFYKVTHIKGKAIVCDSPAVGMDVDKPHQLDIVRAVLTNHSISSSSSYPSAPSH